MNRVPGLVSVLCPTRNRAHNVHRLLDSMEATAAGLIEVVFYTDEDAPLGGEGKRSYVTEVNGPRIVLSQMWNECYAASRGEVVMQCGDDIVFRTPEWDRRVRQAFNECPDKVLLVYGNDLFQGRNLATHGFVHHTWPDTLGYFTPKHFSCDYGDQWLFDIAVMLGRTRYLDDVVTEHMHPVAGKAPWDQNHQERVERGDRDGIHDLYRSLLPEREAAADKLRKLMQ